MNHEPFTIGQKLAAIRFLFMLPIGTMMHIKTYPPLVFDYVFYEGYLQDFPWVSLVEDDLGTSLARYYRRLPADEFKQIILRSRIYKVHELHMAAREVWMDRMELGDLEAVILKYAYKNAYRHKDII